MGTTHTALRKRMETRLIPVEFSEADVLFLHAVACLSDGRNRLIRLVRKRITPVALKLLEERREYNE